MNTMNRAPFLLIDAGNSRIKWALAQADGTQIHTGAFAHDDDMTCVPSWATLLPPRSAWISNVAGKAAAHHIDRLINAHWPALPRTTIHAQAQQCGVHNGYAQPATLGSDRWAGLIGARAAFPGQALLIATLGTATTLEALRADGTFVGGLIVPGWSLMMRSLGENTAQLPAMAAPLTDDAQPLPSPSFVATHSFVATGTHDAMASGCTLAQAGLIERAWHDLQREWETPVRLVISGGHAKTVMACVRVPYTHHASLVLAGLAVIASTSHP
jgi:type III pantothenate kinase